eukprot:gene10470-biopygen131
MAQTLKDKVGLDGRAASDLAEDCARNWPDPSVAKIAAAAAEAGTPLDSRAILQIEKLIASSQKQTQQQIGTLQKQMLEGKQAFQASSLEAKEIQKAVEASLKTLRTEQSVSTSSRRTEALEAEQLQQALEQSLNLMRKESLERESKWKEEAPKKSRADDDGGIGGSGDSDQDDSRDRDRDDSREGSGPSPRAIAREEWQIGQLVLAKEDRRGEFTEAEIVKTDRKLGVQVKWADSGVEKWLRSDMWAARLKESCRNEESPRVKLRK